jgi:nitrogen-specific signal transduction histidine kinase
LKARPLHDRAGEPAGAVLVLRDVSESRRTQEQLMVSDRMASLGLLSAGVAHEINNPLAAVLANVELALREASARAGGGEEWLQTLLAELEDADEAGKRIREIVWDLKLFSRVSQSEELAPIDVNRVLDSCIRMAHNEIRCRAELVRNYSPVPFVRADEAKLGQVFLNLLINAAQAIDGSGARENEIRVSTSVADDGRVVVEVRDTGCGMTQQVMDSLFTAFFTTKPAGVGTGLGLSISQRIVAAFGGEITIESAVGKGSTFRVHLPPSQAPTVEVQASKAEPARPSRRGRILIIDEEPKVVTVLCRCLSPDHDVFVTNALDAMKGIRNGAAFDVILCGLMMSRTTGMDIYESLLRNAPKQAEKLEFMTGGAFTPRALTFLDTVDNPHIAKPFDIAALKALVNEWLA